MTARIRYYVAASLDGFIASLDGGVDWLEPYASEALGFHAFLQTVGAVVMGRKTYDFIHGTGSWPYGTRPGLVWSHRELAPLPDAPVERAKMPIDDMIPHLRAMEGGDIWVVGGGKLAAQFLAIGALDEIEVYTIPLLLGGGVPLFGPLDHRVPLELRESRRFENGVQRLRYTVPPMPG